jgi:AraC-like DNA-binding protein
MSIETTTIQIKNMVCDRCIKVVNDELKALGLNVVSINLGNATFVSNKSISVESIENSLHKSGFEILLSNEEKMVEKIKNAITEFIYKDKTNSSDFSFSKYITNITGKSYNQVSTIFSKSTKITIEKYAILQRIERAKELIEYNENSFAEIAFILGYKNPQHLSNQFKSITGLSMGEYKKLDIKTRKPLNTL